MSCSPVSGLTVTEGPLYGSGGRRRAGRKEALSGRWAVSVINLNKSPDLRPNAVRGSLGFIFLSGIQMVL